MKRHAPAHRCRSNNGLRTTVGDHAVRLFSAPPARRGVAATPSQMEVALILSLGRVAARVENSKREREAEPIARHRCARRETVERTTARSRSLLGAYAQRLVALAPRLFVTEPPLPNSISREARYPSTAQRRAQSVIWTAIADAAVALERQTPKASDPWILSDLS